MTDAHADAVRVALVGYGLAGRFFHRPLIAAVDGLALTHVVTADGARAAAAAADTPGVAVVAAAEELWARAGEFDAVVVAAPNSSHVPLAAAAVERGKATVVDKPLAVTAADARALADSAAELGVPLTVFHNRRWDSDTLAVRRLLAEGVLGPVHRFESRFERFRPEVADRWREQSPSAGGGMLLDLGTHLVDQAVHLFGPVAAVYAEVAVRRPAAVAEDDCVLLLRHAGGVTSQLWCGLATPAAGVRVRVQGASAGYVKATLDGQEAALRAGGDPRADGWVSEPDGRLYDPAWRAVPSPPGRWVTFYERFAAAVRDGAAVPVEPADAVHVLEVLEAARASSAGHTVVEV